MVGSCSQWWLALIYFTASVVLAFMAISTALHASSNNASPPTQTTTYQLSLNASRALRRLGFNTIATLLQISPEILLSSPNSTIFAIQDSAISNVSVPPGLLKGLLQYHTSPLKLSMNYLLNKPLPSCLPTLLHRRNVAITKICAKERLVEINHVLVSHPDIFFEGPLSIHGVLRPFSSLDPQDVQQVQEHGRMDPIIRLLSSNGFVSFSIALHSVIDGILEHNTSLNSTTIFAPPDFAFVASSSPLLRLVRFHILPQRLTYKELASLPDKTLLRTLVANQDLEISGGINLTLGSAIDGVQIVAPDIFSSNKFVIHGISQAFRDGKIS
ncbi:hypothetical protein ACOSP7_002552 [Xanthoceras sorbifolium]